ncbi:MAG: hypothetical protein IPF92_02640 [Myxococcales bacterium]|jgi:hypothetical protein|nr:hypothetical protein [Myxococcales bacterium]MBL0197309.1 hypothetical protein [Myxococcales bacterium]HQY62966.1 hypothetical protein [Polyangiaceae bacterium]
MSGTATSSTRACLARGARGAGLLWAASLATAPSAAYGEPSRELAALADKPGYMQLQARALVGAGLRFNNPYRLATPLGSTAESVSRAPFYLDVGAAGLLGSPRGFQHGVDLGLATSLEGVAQSVFTPSYVLYRRWHALAGAARVGTPIVLGPDVTWGLELAMSVTYFVRGALGVRAEIVGDVFYGAGTVERRVPAYPMLSGALGLVFAYEVLP